MNNEIERIKELLPIDEVISSYIKLEKSGTNFKARCPFHNEKTPSFYVSPDKGIFKCFGCGVAGDIFTFVEKYESISFQEALKKLADKAGVPLSQNQNKNSEKNKNLYQILEDVTLFWQKNLLQNEEVKNYLKKRGINGETAKKFRLGYAPDSWDKTLNYLYQKKYTLEEMEKVGLIKKNEQGKHYDRFRNRIIFPFFNLEGKPVAFSGRDFSGSDKVAKYLNSPETPLFNKSKILYGLNFAKNEARKRGYFILTEGQMDLVMSHQAGFENTIATSGTSLTDEHLKILSRYTKNLILSFDSDKAGINASYKALIKALKLGFNIKIIEMEEGKDPADTILESPQKWIKKVSEANDWLNFFIKKIIFQDKKDEEKIKEMEEKILPFVKIISDPLLKGKYIAKISDGFGIKEEFVIEALEKIETEKINFLEEEKEENILEIFPKKGIIYNTKLKILRELFSIYFWQSELEKSWIDLEKIIKKIEEFSESEKFFKLNQFQKNQLILEVQVKYETSTKENLEFVLNNLFDRLKQIQIDEEIEKTKEILNFLEDEKEKKKELLKLQNLIKQKHNYDSKKEKR